MSTCNRCGQSFTQLSTRGRKQIYCSQECSRAANARKAEGPFQHDCLYCRQSFESRFRKASYCSESCKGFARRKAVDVRNCKQCGKTFQPNDYRSVHCSRACAAITRDLENPRELMVCECKTCGVSFKPARIEIDSHDYCSSACRTIGRIMSKTCETCNKTFSGTVAMKYCSQTCRTTMNDRARNLLRQQRLLLNPKSQVDKTCPDCGKGFQVVSTLQHIKHYCSDYCARAVSNRKRRARKRKAFVEHVYMNVLQVRDNGICKICNLPVDFGAVAPHVNAPTIDHIIPLAKGGKHSYANCQLAHFMCNSKKSDKVA